MMNCSDVQLQMATWLDGTWTMRARMEIESHLNVCASCRHFWQSLQDTEIALRAMAEHADEWLPSISLPADPAVEAMKQWRLSMTEKRSIRVRFTAWLASDDRGVRRVNAMVSAVFMLLFYFIFPSQPIGPQAVPAETVMVRGAGEPAIDPASLPDYSKVSATVEFVYRSEKIHSGSVQKKKRTVQELLTLTDEELAIKRKTTGHKQTKPVQRQSDPLADGLNQQKRTGLQPPKAKGLSPAAQKANTVAGRTLTSATANALQKSDVSGTLKGAAALAVAKPAQPAERPLQVRGEQEGQEPVSGHMPEYQVTFYVSDCKTGTDLSCAVIGNFSDWDIDGALLLTTEDGYRWSGSAVFPEGTDLQFKVAGIDPAGRIIWKTGKTYTHLTGAEETVIRIAFKK